MGYRTLRECIRDLEQNGHLVRISEMVDPNLEAAEIHRRVFRAGGPAIFYENVAGTAFPMVSNLFGTRDRIRFLFRDTLETLEKMMTLGVDPTDVFRRPRLYLNLKTPMAAWRSRPRMVKNGPATANEISLDMLPQLRCWPMDGGAYITLPQVYTEDPDQPGIAHSNLGMYRVQISGGSYAPGEEVGLHYQLHRGIGAHHEKAIRQNKPLRVNVFIGGPPALSFAAVMPLPEGVSELAFAGVLGRRRVDLIRRGTGLPIAAEADFCLSGYILPDKRLPEGPFGDHLGYYSLAHDFPVMRVEHVFHRDRPIWPFTVVGRPPQEDTLFGELIHDLTSKIIPKQIPGVRAVHAVDAAGVHPLLLAVGSERYTPMDGKRIPRELLTLANAILGTGQLSLAKYLFIVAGEDDPNLDCRIISDFFRHLLSRVDWTRDLHFQTCTTIDTLDYSGDELNTGSKVVIAAAGEPIRSLPVGLDTTTQLPAQLGYKDPRCVLPGILVIQGPPYEEAGQQQPIQDFCNSFKADDPICGFPLIVVVDDVSAATGSLESFLWTTFTRSNPATDICGIDSFMINKHWGCRGSLVIDARSKPHHAPALEADPEVSRKVDQLFIRGGSLHGIE